MRLRQGFLHHHVSLHILECTCWMQCCKDCKGLDVEEGVVQYPSSLVTCQDGIEQAARKGSLCETQSKHACSHCSNIRDSGNLRVRKD